MKKTNFRSGKDVAFAIEFKDEKTRDAAFKDLARYALLRDYVLSGHDEIFAGVGDLDELVKNLAEAQMKCKHLFMPLMRVQIAGEPVFEKCGFCGVLRQEPKAKGPTQ